MINQIVGIFDRNLGQSTRELSVRWYGVWNTLWFISLMELIDMWSKRRVMDFLRCGNAVQFPDESSWIVITKWGLLGMWCQAVGRSFPEPGRREISENSLVNARIGAWSHWRIDHVYRMDRLRGWGMLPVGDSSGKSWKCRWCLCDSSLSSCWLLIDRIGLAFF